MPEAEEAAKWIQYSKHTKHPLKEVYKNSEFECKCCKTEGKGTRYRCEQCNFDIHSTCGTTPMLLSSFTHPQHTLQLMDKPNLPFHRCNLCKNFIRGMVYRCKACSFFVHPVCSQFPQELVKHDIHPPHTLKLRLLASKKCDVCDESCKHWRYFCGICEVHIHVGCLSGKKPNDGNDEGGFGQVGEVLGGIFNIVQIAQGFSS